jgi:uncharacterized protein (TIGR00251 family)
MSISKKNEGILLAIYVKPKSPKFQIELDDNELIVYSTEEPEKGKVNKEIVKELTRLFNCQVEMVSGFTSRQKKVFVKGINQKQAGDILKSVIGKT